MRGALHISLALLSCCILSLSQGCGTDEAIEDNYSTNGSDKNEPDKAAEVVPPAPLPTDVGPVVPVVPPVIPVPVPVPVPVPFHGGGGGSQGAVEPADTGNPDHDVIIPAETLCADGIDNDDDGLVDCADPNCINQSCTDDNGCTVGDICVPTEGDFLICSGGPVDCEDEVGNECTVDVCISTGPDTHVCASSLDQEEVTFGSCTPEGNCADPDEDGDCPEGEVIDTCLVGRCVEIPGVGASPSTFTCESEERVFLTPEDVANGCNDGNTCTADGCLEGDCFYSILNGSPCIDGNQCTLADFCTLDVCGGTENAPATCELDSDCGELGDCVQYCSLTAQDCQDAPCTLNVCTAGLCSLTNQGCVTTLDCPVNTCPEFGICACDEDDNECRTNEGCVLGDGELISTCVGLASTTPDNNSCSLDSQCKEGICFGEAAGACSIGGAPCFFDGQCGLGTCVGEVFGSCSCDTGNPCTTDICTAADACVTGANSPNLTPCPDDVTCTTDLCNGLGTCIHTPIDDACPSDTVCQECICDVVAGCSCTALDGEQVCELNLNDLSEPLDIILGDLDLDCDIGLISCVNGDDVGVCALNDAFVLICSEAVLEANCEDDGLSVDLSAELAESICEELNAFLNPVL